MQIAVPSDWPRTEAQAVAEQERLRRQVRCTGLVLSSVRTVAGADVAYDKDSARAVAAVVVMDAATLRVVAEHTATAAARFPYIPGLLAFRELPALLEALRCLEVVPDVLVCDGYGLAHPRRFGLACHLGVVSGLPSVGVAKTAFVGEHAPPAAHRGASCDLVDHGEVVGRVVRTQDNVNPVFVSIGHAVDLATASQLVLAVSPHHRLPETTRAADHVARTVLAR